MRSELRASQERHVTTSKPRQRMGPFGRVQVDARWSNAALLGGLTGVFLVNALVALLQPSDVTTLVERSVVGRWFPMMRGDWLAWMIGINDLLVALCLVASIRSPRARSDRARLGRRLAARCHTHQADVAAAARRMSASVRRGIEAMPAIACATLAQLSDVTALHASRSSEADESWNDRASHSYRYARRSHAEPSSRTPRRVGWRV